MIKRTHKSRRYWHKYIVMNEKANKSVDRGVDADWPLDVNLQAKWKHLPKYRGTKYRGLKRWFAKGHSIAKVIKGDKND